MVSEEMRNVDAWLFDLGNVVIGIDFELALAAWATAAGRDIDDLRQRFHFDEAYERHERGQIEAPEYFAALRSMLEAQTPMGRFGEPDDIAWAAVYLASDEARFVTGQTLSPNGGWYMSQ